ncbi:MAG TPA: Trp biosynthesis-associated membrane protein [Candidatus Saccharimonadales bacterium]
MKGISNKAIVASIGLASSAVLCIVSTFLPWMTAGGSGTNSYDSYFSGTPETLLIASGIILAATALSVFKHNKITRILNGVIGILAAIVIAGMSLILYFNDRGGMNSINSFANSNFNFSTNGFVSIGIGNYLAMASAVAILVFSILVLVSGKSGKKTELKAAEA